jgi:hypothetical protein
MSPATAWQTCATASKPDTGRLRTVELGVLCCAYRERLQELALRSEILSLNNQILHTAEAVSDLSQLIDAIVALARDCIGDDQTFLLQCTTFSFALAAN